MLTTEVTVALIGLLGSAIGTFAGILASAKLTTYRINQLEKKVDKHNTVIERTYIMEEKIKVVNHRIDDIEHLLEKER